MIVDVENTKTPFVVNKPNDSRAAVDDGPSEKQVKNPGKDNFVNECEGQSWQNKSNAIRAL